MSSHRPNPPRRSIITKGASVFIRVHSRGKEKPRREKSATRFFYQVPARKALAKGDYLCIAWLKVLSAFFVAGWPYSTWPWPAVRPSDMGVQLPPLAQAARPITASTGSASAKRFIVLFLFMVMAFPEGGGLFTTL